MAEADKPVGDRRSATTSPATVVVNAKSAEVVAFSRSILELRGSDTACLQPKASEGDTVGSDRLEFRGGGRV